MKLVSANTDERNTSLHCFVMASRIFQRFSRLTSTLKNETYGFYNRVIMESKTKITTSATRDFNVYPTHPAPASAKQTRGRRPNKTVFPKRVEVVPRVSSDPFKHSNHLMQKGKQDDFQIPYDEEITGDIDELDYLAQSVTNHGSKHSGFAAEMDKTREILRLKSFVRAKTIGKRHFKQRKQPNLLTWACKEQIRFLHERDPDEWSVQELALKFPVSELSIRKILKSRVRLHRVVDIKEHDLFVRRNWEKLLDSLVPISNSKRRMDGDNDGDSIQDVLANIGSEENLHNIFPMEDETTHGQLSIRPIRRKLGMFSSMVEDQIERRELEIDLLSKKHQEDLDQLRNTIGKVKQILVNLEVDVQRSMNSETKTEQKQNKAQSPKHDKSPFKVSVSEGGQKVVDGSVYDQNGDFLYRIP